MYKHCWLVTGTIKALRQSGRKCSERASCLTGDGFLTSLDKVVSVTYPCASLCFKLTQNNSSKFFFLFVFLLLKDCVYLYSLKVACFYLKKSDLCCQNRPTSKPTYSIDAHMFLTTWLFETCMRVKQSSQILAHLPGVCTVLNRLCFVFNDVKI